MTRLFIDASGTPGTRNLSSTSPFYAVCAVIFEDEVQTQMMERIHIEAFGVGSRAEVKSGRASRIRDQFLFRALAEVSWYYCMAIGLKEELRTEGFKYPISFMKFFLGRLLERSRPMLLGATLTIDTCGSSSTDNEIKEYLLNRVGSSLEIPIERIEFANSLDSPGIQLADNICGAVLRCYKRNTKQILQLRELLSSREIVVWEFPSKNN